ncbi:HaeIII family restriction endonuclease [Prevotella intermedia]|jgi:HaeIII restriction endonuclease.|uniref:HaeIII family restriction endonuclease n=1 Tax=Prevotella intermedia TaxID=28131 RepID=UPI00200612F4|nr:HaeIII family restriction endonuclease [Prevotella intermedia]MCK6144965.1 HaeIII family restriction endonuclease [Prevotella intermedia]
MSNTSNNHGRAYEFICLNALYDAISKVRPTKIIKNSSYTVAEKAWNVLSQIEKDLYTLSATSTIDTIFALEPNIVEKSNDILNLYIQNDQHGKKADVRDIIIQRKDIIWEIGLSIKHNHMAVKHSRIAKTLDFGKQWYETPCSASYWNEVKPTFDFLEEEKNNRTRFCELKSKQDKVYVPLLKAFVNEVTKQVKANKSIPRKMVEYLLSKYDFYKVISIDSKRITTIQSFNMYGTLNLSSKVAKPTIKVPIINLPTTLLHIGFKPKNKTTVVMCFDNGWQFSFRIHNAKKEIETSLKFDIQIVGMPADINLKHICKW